MPSLLKVRLSLKGRPLRTYTFNKETISIGRDPNADIFLDNTGISREHALIDRTSEGYVLEDLGSANGTFLNDAAVTRQILGNDDVVRIGKFTLWVDLEGDRRDRKLAGGFPSPQTFERTMILSPEQMVDLARKAKADEENVTRRAAPSPPPAPWNLTRSSFVLAVVAALFVGIFLGAASALNYLR